MVKTNTTVQETEQVRVERDYSIVSYHTYGKEHRGTDPFFVIQVPEDIWDAFAKAKEEYYKYLHLIDALYYAVDWDEKARKAHEERHKSD